MDNLLLSTVTARDERGLAEALVESAIRTNRWNDGTVSTNVGNHHGDVW